MSGKFARIKRRLELESLESRKCLAASLGWDGPGLGSANLSYYIAPVPASVGLTQDQVASAVKTALDAWANVASIKFTPTNLPNQQRSLDITFAKLDGPGGTLAQAYFPGDSYRSTIGGDVQFDLSDTWEIGNARGGAATDLTFVAAHEIGHALGVDHISGSSSVMNPSVSPTQSFTQLDPAAVDAIHALYAPATNSTSSSTSTDGSLSGGTGTATTDSGSSEDSGNTGATIPTSPPTTTLPRTSPFSHRGFRHGGRWSLPWTTSNGATGSENGGDPTSNSNDSADPTTNDGTTPTTPDNTSNNTDTNSGASNPIDPTTTDGTTNGDGSGTTGTTNGTDGTGGCSHRHVRPGAGGTDNSTGGTSTSGATNNSNGQTTSSTTGAFNRTGWILPTLSLQIGRTGVATGRSLSGFGVFSPYYSSIRASLPILRFVR